MTYVAEVGQAPLFTQLPSVSLTAAFPGAELTPLALAFISFTASFNTAEPPKSLNQYAQTSKHRSLTTLMQTSL